MIFSNTAPGSGSGRGKCWTSSRPGACITAARTVEDTLCFHLAQRLTCRQDATVLHRQRLQACAVEVRCIRRDGVRDDCDLETFMEGTARGVFDADLGD